MYVHRRNTFDSLTKGQMAFSLADRMRLFDRNQRVNEAYVRRMEPAVKPEDEDVKLVVDSPTTTNHCHPYPPVNPWPWLFAMTLLIVMAGVGWFVFNGSRTIPTPASPPTTQPQPVPHEGLDIQVIPPDPPLMQ